MKPRSQRHRGPVGAHHGVTVRMVALTVVGLGSLLAEELGEISGVKVRDRGYDGRSDVVLFDAEPTSVQALLSLRLAEDVYVEVGRTLRQHGDNPNWISGRIWKASRAQRAVKIWSTVRNASSHGVTVRVVARILQERSFLRTDLRRQFVKAVGASFPKWKFTDPAKLEVWVTEYKAGQIIAAIRLTDHRMRQSGGRRVERQGALRPVVAAAMLRLAGVPGEVLLDPCCGSGTILREALDCGWSQARGIDIDPEAVRVARANVPAASFETGDVRRLKLADPVDAVVSNLPWGKQFAVDDQWILDTLARIAELTKPGGRVVILAPSVQKQLVPPTLHLRRRIRISLLGQKSTLWCYTRR